MNINIAKIISAIFHPLLVPTYALLLLLNLQTHSMLMLPADFKYIIVAFVFTTTFILPSIIIYILLKFGKIQSLQMQSQQERILPMLIITLAFYGTYFLLKQSAVTGLMSLFMIGATMLVLIALLINYITKISLHMTAWGGLFGTFLGFAISYNYNLIPMLSILVFVISTIATARLKLNAHTPLQVYLGFLTGTGVMVFLFFI